MLFCCLPAGVRMPTCFRPADAWFLPLGVRPRLWPRFHAGLYLRLRRRTGR